MVKRILAAGVLVLAGFAQSAQAAVISLVPVNQTVNIGDPVSVDIMVTLGQNEAVGGVSLLVSFSDVVLDGVSYVADPDGKMGTALNPLLNDFSGGFGAGGTSPLNLFFLADVSIDTFADLKPLQGAGFRLATVNFIAAAAGISPIVVSANGGAYLSAAEGQGTLPGNDATAAVCVRDEAGNIGRCAAVPEPATMSLLGVGLSLLAVRRRKTQA